MWLLDLTNKQTILSQYDNREIFNILGNILFQFWFFKRKKKLKDAIGIECNMKKVLQKKVLSFGTNRRVEVRPNRTFGRSLGYRTFIGKSYVILSIRYIPRNFIGFINRIARYLTVRLLYTWEFYRIYL